MNNLVNNAEQEARVAELRQRFDDWRDTHPANYTADPHVRWATFNAPEIDWARFKKKHPKKYGNIAK